MRISPRFLRRLPNNIRDGVTAYSWSYLMRCGSFHLPLNLRFPLMSLSSFACVRSCNSTKTHHPVILEGITIQFANRIVSRHTIIRLL